MPLVPTRWVDGAPVDTAAGGPAVHGGMLKIRHPSERHMGECGSLPPFPAVECLSRLVDFSSRFLSLPPSVIIHRSVASRVRIAPQTSPYYSLVLTPRKSPSKQHV